MKYTYAVLSFIIALLAAGCSPGQKKYAPIEYREQSVAKFELITGELEGINVVNGIYHTGKYLAVVGYDMKDGSMVHLFDRRTRERVADAVYLGRGPKELVFPLVNCIDHTRGAVSFYDYSKSVHLTFPIDGFASDGLSAVQETPFQVEPFTWNILDVGEDHRLIIRNTISMKDSLAHRIEFRGEDGQALSFYDGYPEIDERDKLYVMYHMPRATVSPDGKKFAVVSKWSGVLELFSLASGKIRNTGVRYILPPLFETGPNYSLNFNDQSKMGFVDVTSTDSRIYTVFGGEVNMEVNDGKPVEEKLLTYPDIVVFDWKGTPLRKIETDYNISRITVDESENVLYAAVKDLYGRIYIGRIGI